MKASLFFNFILLFFCSAFADNVKVSFTTADILFVGDSHSTGCFGQVLDQQIRKLQNPSTKKPVTLQSVATCGSSSASWLIPNGHSTNCGFRKCNTDGKCENAVDGQSDSLKQCLKDSGPKPNPKIAIIALGSNMLKDDINQVMLQTVKLIKQTADSRCVWIGPPQAAVSVISVNAYDQFVQKLESTVTSNGCYFVNSSDKTNRGNLHDPLGLHYSCSDATKWSQKVSAQLVPVLSNDLQAPNAISIPNGFIN